MSVGFLHRLVARAAAGPPGVDEGAGTDGAATSGASAAPDPTPPTAAVATLVWGADGDAWGTGGHDIGAGPGTGRAHGTGVLGHDPDAGSSGSGHGTDGTGARRTAHAEGRRPAPPRAAARQAEDASRILGTATSTSPPARPPARTDTSAGGNGGADPAGASLASRDSAAAAAARDALPVDRTPAGTWPTPTVRSTSDRGETSVDGARTSTSEAPGPPGGAAAPASATRGGTDVQGPAGLRGTHLRPHGPALAHAAVRADGPRPRPAVAGRSARRSDEAADHPTEAQRSPQQPDVVDLHIGTIEIIADAPTVAPPASDPLARLQAARRHEWSSA